MYAPELSPTGLGLSGGCRSDSFFPLPATPLLAEATTNYYYSRTPDGG